MTSNRHNGILDGVDRGTVLLYVLIVLAGFVSIFSASYDDSAAQTFSFSHFYMKQLVWIGIAWVTALVVLLLDERYYHMFQGGELEWLLRSFSEIRIKESWYERENWFVEIERLFTV